MHVPLNVKIEKCEFKNISDVAVGLNERRGSAGNNMSSKSWQEKSGKV
jgi:hypothetical protein